MNTPPPVLQYAVNTAPARAVEWERAPDGTVSIVIPPPALWRQLVDPVVTLALGSGMVVYLLGMARDVRDVMEIRFEFAVILLVLAGVWLWAVVTLVRTARHGWMPTVIVVSPAALSVHLPPVPPVPPARRRRWPACEIAEVRVNGIGAATAVAGHFRLRVIRHPPAMADLDGNMRDHYDVKIPWDGTVPLVEVETVIRETLGGKP